MRDYGNQAFIAQVLTFWDKINMQERDLILQNIKTTSYKKGENIYSGIDDCKGILLIKEGRLRVYILSEEGREVTLYHLDKGEVCILSSSCIIKNITFDVYIDAEIDCDLLVISSTVFSKMASQNIYIENFMYKDAMARFSDVMWAIEHILFMRFDQRLAMFLLDEVAKNETDIIMLTQDLIAKNMGSAREVVSRMLKHFTNEGLVQLFRGGVKVVDKKRLKNLI